LWALEGINGALTTLQGNGDRGMSDDVNGRDPRCYKNIVAAITRQWRPAHCESVSTLLIKEIRSLGFIVSNWIEYHLALSEGREKSPFQGNTARSLALRLIEPAQFQDRLKSSILRWLGHHRR